MGLGEDATVELLNDERELSGSLEWVMVAVCLRTPHVMLREFH